MKIDDDKKGAIRDAIESLDTSLSGRELREPIPFEEFLGELSRNPSRAMRNVFQAFHDMVAAYVDRGQDEYPDDPESIDFVPYDCSRLLAEGTDNPFFADRLFANRLMNHIGALRKGAQQNKIYVFKGPHGCGKSTFLNNLLGKFEEYSNTEEGTRYETLWRLDEEILGETRPGEGDGRPSTDGLVEIRDGHLDIPCPSHDNPILMIPKEFRRRFFDDLFQNDQQKWRLFTEKEYEWVFTDTPCTICSSLYRALLARLKSPLKVLRMIYARPYRFDRRQGEGISVYNPGDKSMRDEILVNEMLQRRIDSILGDSNLVKYLFSEFAKTNNGVYALMDIKSHNVERLIRLHNTISEGVHKVGYIEENVDSLFLALMNPEDTKNIQDFPSFSDRIEYLNIPYVLDMNTEVEIYRNVFGRHIESNFLPRVLKNFARVIIASRMSTESETMMEWLGDPAKYERYCDPSFLLLRMQIYTGRIPLWLSEEDRKAFTAKVRRRLIAEGEREGHEGFSGRDSIKIFGDFYSRYSKDDGLIGMSTLVSYFTKARKDLAEQIPEGFVDCLLRMYDFNVLQEVKESLYYYNEEQISRDVLDYLYAINFEIGTAVRCPYTGDRIEITDAYLDRFEHRVLGQDSGDERRLAFRKDVQKRYASRTLTQEILVESKQITESALYGDLHDRYVYRLKDRVLDPFLKNQNFRRAIKDYDTETFKTYDKRIREDVSFLIDNLVRKYGYTTQGAREVCVYVIDNSLAERFAEP